MWAHRRHQIATRLLEFALGIFLMTPLRAQDVEPSPSASSTTPPSPQVNFSAFFQRTEDAVRARTPDRLRAHAFELSRLGLEGAVREVAQGLPPIDLDRLTEDLLAFNAPTAALEVARHRLRTDTRASLPLLHEAIALAATGSPELALRSLGQVSAPLSPGKDLAAAMLRELLHFQIAAGKPASPEANPWGIVFQPFEPGQIDPLQRTRIPSSASVSLSELLLLWPTAGNLWALLGEILNAQGDPRNARICLERAMQFNFSPRQVVEHHRVLQRYLREQEGLADASLTPSEGTEPSAEGGWARLTNRPRTLMVLVGGGILALAIGVLQIRAWMASSRR